MLTEHLDNRTMRELGEKIGADEKATQKAVAAALPMLIGGLARNANASSSGAESLANALDRDHDGSLLSDLEGLLGGGSGGGSGLSGLMNLAGGLLGDSTPKAVNGEGILGHILGQRKEPVQKGVAKASGLDMSQIAKLLPMLAPLVMSALGKVKKEKNLDAKDLAGMLGDERSQIEKRTPGLGEGGLASYLDFDGDGDISDDVAKIGSALAGSGLLDKLFRK